MILPNQVLLGTLRARTSFLCEVDVIRLGIGVPWE